MPHPYAAGTTCRKADIMLRRKILTIATIGMLSMTSLPVMAAEAATTAATAADAATAATAAASVAATDAHASAETAAAAAQATITIGGEEQVISQQVYETLAYYLSDHQWWNAITLLQSMTLPAGTSTNGNDMIYVTTSFGTLGIGCSTRQYAHLVEDPYGYCVACYQIVQRTPKPMYVEGDLNRDGHVDETDAFILAHSGEKRTYDGTIGQYSQLVP